MKRFITICILAMFLTMVGTGYAKSIKSDPLYKASTDLTLGEWTTVWMGIEGYAISNEFQLNLLYQDAILEEDIDSFNHYWQVISGATYNFPDAEEYVLNISATGGLIIYQYEGLNEIIGGPEIKWTLTAWHQTILAGDIIDNGDGTITFKVLPEGTYRPFVNDPPVNNVEIFDGDLDCEVLGYTFTGSIGDVGDGSVLSVNLVPGANSNQASKVIHVPRDFKTIQEAIDSANAGDTIQIAKGKYYGAVVTKAVEIKGTKGTIINDGPLLSPAQPCGNVLNIGFQFGFDGNPPGDGATISNLTFEDLAFPVFSRGANDVTVTQCIMENPIQGITNWMGSRWEINYNTITDLRAVNGGGIGVLVGDLSGGIVSDNIVSHNTISGTLHVASCDEGGYDGTGIVLFADWRYGRDGSSLMSFNRITKNKISLVSDTPNVVDIWAIELTEHSNPGDIVIKYNSVGFNDLRKTEKQISLTPDALDEYNDISRNLGENRGHGLHPSVFGPGGNP